MEFREVIALFIKYLISMDRSIETIKGYEKDLNMINRYLIETYNTQFYLEDIKTEDLENYLYMLKDVKGYQAASRNRHLNTMRSFYNFCIKKELLDRSPAAPIEQVRVQQKEREYPDEDEVKELVQAIDHELIRLVVRFLFMTGLRISECLNLTLDDVDLEKKQIHVRQGKGNKDRFVPISDKLKPLLQDYKSNKRVNTSSNYFFATKKTGRLSAVYVNRVLAETTKKLGWNKKVTAHSFRHGAASLLIKKGVSPVYVQKILGHADLKTTSIYLHANKDQLEEAMNTL